MTAAIDSTGYDARPASHYFVRQSGRRLRPRHGPKRTAVVDVRTHRVLAAAVPRGPPQDAPHLAPAVRAAVARGRIDTLLADAGYDSAANHTAPRELGVRATVIALNWRGSRKWPRTPYRRQMVRRPREVYGQRWQAESAFSRLKRRLGSAVASVRWPNQRAEILLKVFAYNILLLSPRVST